ncbi:MAG TPA: serine hydrolase [Candidatus Saccharimonadales bacterium]
MSRWFRRHPRLVRYTFTTIGAVLFVVVAAQLLYPADRTLPMVKVAGKTIGAKSAIDAGKIIDKEYTNATLTIKTSDHSFTQPFAEIGVDVNGWKTARSAARYSLGQRLIPFSAMYVMLRRDTPIQVDIDDERLKYFAEQTEKNAFIAAVDASVAVKQDKVELVPAKKSKEYPKQKVLAAVYDAPFKPQTTITLAPETKPAERTDQEVQAVLEQAQRAVNTPLTLQLDGQKVVVEKTTIGSWLDFPEDPATKKLQLALRADAVKKYLEGVQSKVYKAPGTTTIQLIDGKEVGRTEGASGRGVDTDKTLALLNTAIQNGNEATVGVPLTTIPAKIVYDRQYSNTDAGLAALLADLVKDKNVGISVMEIGGRAAHAGGGKSFVAASTYKLFVAYAVFKEIDAGRMAWGDPISGRTVDGCFEVMIVKSDNPCAKALGDKIGWQKVEDMMKGLGLSSTELSPSLSTTSADLALFNYKLANGTLLDSGQSAKLLDVMKRQVYRSGIPAGTGVTVADKVGFIDSYIHDAAIVYGPKTYSLTIMTSGASWATIADMAKQIHAFLNR